MRCLGGPNFTWLPPRSISASHPQWCYLPTARFAPGYANLALAYARAPQAAAIRGEMARSLLDLASSRPAVRLTRVRELL